MTSDVDKRFVRLEDEIISLRRSVLICLESIRELQDIVARRVPISAQEAIEFMIEDSERIMAVARDGSLCPELKAEAAAAAGPILDAIERALSILRKALDG